MLVAAPYRDLDGPPRVISEVKKSRVGLLDFRPKLTGELLVKTGSERQWWPRRAAVRNGQLQISAAIGNGTPPALRLPLRHLSLQAGPLPNSLSLCRGKSIVLTLQTASEQAFDIWVKTIAIELIRQTPLEDVKYLDIFTLANWWKQKPENKDCNYNYVEEECQACDHEVAEEKTVQKLFKKCQNVENYVPVREKLILFESLCKLGRKVRSTEDVSCKVLANGAKRTRSMHDLSNLHTNGAVREICKYFEVKNEANNNYVNNVNKYGTISRFDRSDSYLDAAKKY